VLAHLRAVLAHRLLMYGSKRLRDIADELIKTFNLAGD
jgi:hypothetical protein